MSTTRVRIDPGHPSTLPKGKIDPARVDAATETEIAMQEREDEAMQDMARSISPRRSSRTFPLQDGVSPKPAGFVKPDPPPPPPSKKRN